MSVVGGRVGNVGVSVSRVEWGGSSYTARAFFTFSFSFSRIFPIRCPYPPPRFKCYTSSTVLPHPPFLTLEVNTLSQVNE